MQDSAKARFAYVWHGTPLSSRTSRSSPAADRASARRRAGGWPARAPGSRSSTSTRTGPSRWPAEIDGVAYAVDVTDFDAFAAAVADADDARRPDAAVQQRRRQHHAPLHDYPLDEWQRIVTLNLTGVFHGFKAAAPLIWPAAAARSCRLRRSRAPGPRPARRPTPRPRPRSRRSPQPPRSSTRRPSASTRCPRA